MSNNKEVILAIFCQIKFENKEQVKKDGIKKKKIRTGGNSWNIIYHT